MNIAQTHVALLEHINTLISTSLHCVLLTGVDDLSPNDMYVLLVHMWSNKWKIKVRNHIYYEDTRRRTSALQEYVWCTDEATHLEAAHGTLSDQS